MQCCYLNLTGLGGNSKQYLHFFIHFIYRVLLPTDLKPVCQNDGEPTFAGDEWSCSCSNQFTGPYCETGDGILEKIDNKTLN